MSLKFGRVCRGSGVAYLEAMVAVPSAEHTVLFAALSETGVELPVEAYRTDGPGSPSRTYVLATPILDTKKIVVTSTVLGPSGDKISTSTRSISRFALKWLSRLNYKTDREKTVAIRDKERYTYSGQIHVYAQHLHSNPVNGELIIKGYVCMPVEEDNIEFVLLRSDGTVVDDPNIILGSYREAEAFGLPRKEVPFTLRVMSDGRTGCLVVRGSDGCRAGFLGLDGASINFYISTASVESYYELREGRYAPLAARRQRLVRELDKADYSDEPGPKFSVVVPLYNTPVELLRELVDSMYDQLYGNWELVLVNSTPNNDALSSALSSLCDSRIRLVTLEENLGISGNTNAGVEAATGDFVVFADHDDVLDRMALLMFARKLVESPNLDAVYSDEDLLRQDGAYVLPNLKPDFSIDLLRCHNYITHLVAVRADLAREIPLREQYDGAQDYDFLLRLSERTTEIGHVAQVLYHWRMCESSTANNAGNKSYADEAGRAALQDHLDRLGLAAKAEVTDVPFIYRVAYEVEGDPLVSIIIPNKDNLDVLDRCVTSLYEKSTYRNFEIIVIENNSTDPSVFEYYKEVQGRHDNLRVVTWEGPFNYSAINNYGVGLAGGEYLLFLNNDTEVIAPNWIEGMVSYAQRSDVGVVGAKLLYPDDTIQHAGVMMTRASNLALAAGPVHVFNHMDMRDDGYMGRLKRPQDLSAVTAACMMVRRSVFEEASGFDESFAVAYNDIDFCLRVRELGYLVVLNPEVVLRHYESVSRGVDDRGEKRVRFIAEQGRLRERWAKYYDKGDPYHSHTAIERGLTII